QGVSGKEQIKQLTAEIKGPVGINLIEEKPSCGDLSFNDLERLGVARVSLSATLMLAAIRGMRIALQQLQQWDGTRCDPLVFAPFEDLHHLAGIENSKRVERDFVNRDKA